MDHGTYDEHQAYCESVSTPASALLAELVRTTNIQCIHPRMLAGPYLGRVLSMLSKLVKPQRILEIGTYTGYSALCLAEGLSEGATLTTIDRDDELETIRQRYFDRSGFAEQIISITGNALEVLPTLDEQYDLIFLDADKENYANYLPLIISRSKPGTLILVDNMLWEGKVLPPAHDDKQTQSIVELSAMIADHEALEQVMLPIRDGLLMARVK